MCHFRYTARPGRNQTFSDFGPNRYKKKDGKTSGLDRSINSGGAQARARAGNVSDFEILGSLRRLLFRRRWNKTLAVMRTFIAPLALLGILSSTLPAADTSYRDAALEAARWIRASAAQADQGTVWPSDPRDSKSVNDTLYAGTPGVILFFLEA